MARTVTYQLVSNATTTSVNLGSLQIVRPGRIVGTIFAARAAGGAGNGHVDGVIEHNNVGVNNAGLGNPVRDTIIGGASVVVGNAGVAFVPGTLTQVDVPVQVGDYLSISLTVSGTAPATLYCVAKVIVVES